MDLTGLIGAWELNEASGNAVDSHTNGYHLSPSASAPGADAGFGRDFEVDNSQYFSIASNSNLQTGDVDFTIWAEVRLESTSNIRAIVSKDNSGSGKREYSLYYDSGSNRFKFSVYKATDLAQAQTADVLGAPSLATSYHIAAWYNAAADTVNIQVNNGTVDTLPVVAGLQAASDAEFRIGALQFSGANLPFDGTIRRVRLFKRVLTTQERTDLYNGGSGLSYIGMGGTPPAGPTAAEQAGIFASQLSSGVVIGRVDA